MYKVVVKYPNGETKVKATVTLLESAIKYDEHLEKFFARGGFTRTPTGKTVACETVSVEIEEAE